MTSSHIQHGEPDQYGGCGLRLPDSGRVRVCNGYQRPNIRGPVSMLRKYDRGPGDTIEAAAGRIQKEHKVDAAIIMQGWNRPARAMMAHRWLPLFQAWCEAGFAKADAAYEEERKRHADTSALVRLADLVAGRTARPTEEEG